MDETPVFATPLTGLDRCDRCGAQAYVRADLPSGNSLLFCGHHGRAVEAKLRPLAVAWQDETSRLLVTVGA